MDFPQLLANISSSDNQIRAEAEKNLNQEWLYKKPNEFLSNLIQLLVSHSDPNFRSFCAVLFRRVGLRESQLSEEVAVNPWQQASDAVKTGVQSALLGCLHSESVRSVRKKIADSVAELFKCLSAAGEEELNASRVWPELQPSVFQLTKAPSADLRETAFDILAAVPVLFIGAKGQLVDKSLLQMITAALQDNSPNVCLAALRASVALLISDTIGEAQAVNSICETLLVHLASVLVPFYQQKNEEMLVEAMKGLIELAEHFAKHFRKIMPQLIAFITAIVQDSDGMGDSTRQTALELALTLAENAPALCRKLSSPSFAEQIIPATLRMMSEVEDDEEWHETEDIDEFDDPSDNYVVAEQAMDRLSRALGGKTVVPTVFSYLPAMSGSAAWNERYAAMMCLSAMAEGSEKIMSRDLGAVLGMILPRLLEDSHARVKYSACNAIGQMCTDFGPNLQRQFHREILSALCSGMRQQQSSRLQSHCAAALVNYCEGATADLLSPYLDAIFTDLLPLVRSQRMYVQEQAITTLATVADTAGDYFSKYYPSVMPALLEMLQLTSGQQKLRLLRGKIIECASLMTLAVGKQAFQPYQQPFISLLIQTQQSSLEADDPQVSYLLASWARLCKVMGAEFVPYLELVMPPLLQSARHRPDFAVLDPEDDEEEKGFTEEDGWEFVQVDDQKIGIKTTALEEKCTAVEMLICYARELGAGFSGYAEQVLRIVVPLLRFYFHEGVRHAAALVIPHLLKSLRDCGTYDPKALAVIWQQSCSSLLLAINEEQELETLIQFLIGFYEAASVMGQSSLSGALFSPLSPPQSAGSDNSNTTTCDTPLLSYFARAINGQILEVFHRIQAREVERMAEQELYDQEMEESAEEQNEMEDMVLGELSRAVHVVCRTHGKDFLPFFHQELLQAVSGMLRAGDLASTAAASSPVNSNSIDPSSPLSSASNQTMHAQAKQWALCVFDDVIEFLGSSAVDEYQKYYWDPMLRGIMDHQSPDVRQASCYGIGLLANQMATADQNTFSRWSTLLMEALNVLQMSLSMPWAKHEDQSIASENAVAAMAKILQRVAVSLLSPDKLSLTISQWLHYMPVVEDEQEAPCVYGYLLELIERHEPAVLQNLSLVAKILVECLASEVLLESQLPADAELNTRVIAAAKSILSNVDQSVHAQLWNALSTEQKHKLEKAGFV